MRPIAEDADDDRIAALQTHLLQHEALLQSLFYRNFTFRNPMCGPPEAKEADGVDVDNPGHALTSGYLPACPSILLILLGWNAPRPAR